MAPRNIRRGHGHNGFANGPSGHHFVAKTAADVRREQEEYEERLLGPNVMRGVRPGTLMLLGCDVIPQSHPDGLEQLRRVPPGAHCLAKANTLVVYIGQELITERMVSERSNVARLPHCMFMVMGSPKRYVVSNAELEAGMIKRA